MSLSREIRNAREVLIGGGVILYPTDTIWGLGCDATNPEAVRRIYEIKHRAESKAMLVLVDSLQKAAAYVQELPELAWDLTEFSDKPLTVIYDGARNLADNLVAPDGSIGIRVTREAFSQGLCQAFHKAIVSTSANIAGEPSPACFAEVSEEIRKAVDYIVDYRQDEKDKAVPSSIVKLGIDGQIRIIRP